jgi:hypothetical protein
MDDTVKRIDVRKRFGWHIVKEHAIGTSQNFERDYTIQAWYFLEDQIVIFHVLV